MIGKFKFVYLLSDVDPSGDCFVTVNVSFVLIPQNNFVKSILACLLLILQMAYHTSDVSDGEIVEELSEISETEDYFENLRRLTNRKIELEVENACFAGQFGKFAR